MNRNIAKPFAATLSLLDVASDKTNKYKCFHGEDVQLTVNVVGENNKPIDLSNTSVKIYFILDKNVNEPVYRQDTGIVVDNLGIITVMLEKSYIRIGNNTLKIVLYDEDQTVFLQPLIISCIDPLIGEVQDLEIPDDIDVRDELYDIRRIIGDLQDFDDDLGSEIIQARKGHETVGERLDNIDLCLEHIESESSSKIQKVNNAYRSFKPIFGHCVDWSSVSGNNTWEEVRIKTEIDSLVSYGVEKLSVTIQTRCVNGTVSLVSDLERFKKCLDYANEKGLETTTIKVHCNQFRKAIKSNEYDNENLKQQWLNILNDIGEYFKSYCEYFVVINEGENLFLDSSHEEFLLKCLDVGKNKGFKSGFTPSSNGVWDSLPESVKYSCDFIAFNCYPSVSLKGLKTSFEDVINAFEVGKLNNWIDERKKKYNKPVIISEIGCEDRESCLACTYVWDFGNGENLNDGKVQNIMLKGIFEYLKDNDNLDSLYYWFPFKGDNVKNTINYYIGGRYNE